jgi:hypothetical protein
VYRDDVVVDGCEGEGGVALKREKQVTASLAGKGRRKEGGGVVEGRASYMYGRVPFSEPD